MYKVIEKNEYGVLVIDDEILNGISDVCRKCKYLSNCEDEWMKCIINTYYLPDSEAEKLESENQLMNTTIDDLYIESKCYFEVKKKLDDTQKELIDLQIENKKLKERVNELEGTIENMKAIAINLQQPEQVYTITSIDYPSDNETEITEFINDGVEILECNSCGMLMQENEPYNNYCPNCGRRIVR